VAAVVLLALIVFITQNLHPVEVSFLGWNGRFPLVVMVLAAAFIGCVSTLILGSTRILQLRRTAMSARRARARTRMPDHRQGRAAPAPPCREPGGLTKPLIEAGHGRRPGLPA
jgi:uncharacterized integral membrane protein